MQGQETTRSGNAEPEVGLEASILARALELAAESVGRPVAADEAWKAVADHVADAADWTDAAECAAAALGLQAFAHPDPPIGWSAEGAAVARVGPGRWVLARGRRGHRIRIVEMDAHGQSRRTLGARALPDLAGDATWLHLQPRLALDPVSLSRRPALRGRPWLRLRAFLELERRDLWVVAVYAIAIGGLTLATPIAVQALVNTIAFGAVLQPLVVLTTLLFVGLSFAGLLGVLSTYVVEVLQRRVFVRMADDFGRRLTSLRGDALDRQHGPELVNRFFEVLTIQKSLAVLLLDGLGVALQTVIGMVLLGFYHPFLLAFDVLLVLLLVGVLLMGRGAVAAGVRESRAKYATAAWLEDVSRVPHVLRGATAARHVAQRTEMFCRDYLRARRGHFRILVRQIAGGFGLQIVAMVALLGVGGWLVIERQLTLGQLVAAELVIAAIGVGFAKLGKSVEKVYDLAVGVTKVGRVLDLPGERLGGRPLPAGGPASITARGLGIARGHHALVERADLELREGERVLLRGAPGSGKSTLLEVLAALREPSSGSLRIDGLELRRADLPTVRDRVALVREAVFVGASVLENIRLGRPELDESAVRELLRLVELERAVDALAEGLDTRMLPSGAPLSEVHGRRLALVRALASRPRVLLLDRALDGLAMEPPAFRRLLDHVLGAGAPWTAVVVTAEPEVAARCGRAIVIDQHTVREAT